MLSQLLSREISAKTEMGGEKEIESLFKEQRSNECLTEEELKEFLLSSMILC